MPLSSATTRFAAGHRTALPLLLLLALAAWCDPTPARAGIVVMVQVSTAPSPETATFDIQLSTDGLGSHTISGLNFTISTPSGPDIPLTAPRTSTGLAGAPISLCNPSRPTRSTR
ncbi:MAG: hypothetical protein U0835_26935 [Isosphaeraceae bacterium]